MNNREDRPQRAVRIDDWSWRDEWQGTARPGPRVPLVGLFLVVLGLLLLAGELFPNARVGASAFFLAVGIYFLVRWAAERGHGSLYLGVIITSLALASVLSDLGAITGSGWGTLFLGVGFLIVAAVRAGGGAGWGWQIVLGGLLAVVGGSEVLAQSVVGLADADRVVGPLLLLLLGLLLLTRARSPRGRNRY